MVVAAVGAGTEWDAGGVAGKANVCGETAKQVWAIRWQDHQGFW